MDIRVVELLCSRLCHDLVSPVGAIHNGVELIEEMEDDPAGDFMGEAVKLIAHSADQAESRLRLFRFAYGQAGRQAKDFTDLRDTAAGWLDGGRTRLDWPAGSPPDSLASHIGLAKVLLNVIVLADETLTHGGTIGVAGQGDSSGGRVTVTAAGPAGRSVALSPEAAAALSGGAVIDDLTPRTIHAYVTGRFAEGYGLTLKHAPAGTGALAFHLGWG